MLIGMMSPSYCTLWSALNMPCYVIIISWRDWFIFIILKSSSSFYGVGAGEFTQPRLKTHLQTPSVTRLLTNFPSQLSITRMHHNSSSDTFHLALLTHSLWLWSSAFQVSNLILWIKVAQMEDSNTRSGCSKHGLTHIQLQLSSSRSSLPVLKVTRTQVLERSVRVK